MEGTFDVLIFIFVDINYKLIQIDLNLRIFIFYHMLTKLHNQPFKYIIANLKQTVNNQNFEQEQVKIKRTLRTLTKIANLNSFLTILLDYHWFQRLCYLSSQLTNCSQFLQMRQQKCEKIVKSPLSQVKQNDLVKQRQQIRKQRELTPSTKKSENLIYQNVILLIEDLILKLQIFDQMKSNDKKLKLLIQELSNPDDFTLINQKGLDIEVDFQNIWLTIQAAKLQELSRINSIFTQSIQKQYLTQLFQHITNVDKLVKSIKQSMNEILSLLSNSCRNDKQNDSYYSSVIDSFAKKSINPSEQKSLLTEMLRDSSQKSTIQILENQYYSQAISRQKFKYENSRRQDLVFLDEQYRISSKQNDICKKSHKSIKSEMNCHKDEQNELHFSTRKRQVKPKRSAIGCSQCQIF